MQIVIDTSAVLAVVLNEPSRADLIAATRGADLLAPTSLRIEIGNACSAMFKRRRLSLASAQKAVEIFETIPIQQVEIELPSALALAHELGIYAYDAYMIHGAQRYRAPLLTLDGGLKHAAKQAGVQLIEVHG